MVFIRFSSGFFFPSVSYSWVSLSATSPSLSRLAGRRLVASMFHVGGFWKLIRSVEGNTAVNIPKSIAIRENVLNDKDARARLQCDSK